MSRCLKILLIAQMNWERMLTAGGGLNSEVSLGSESRISVEDGD